MNQITKTTLVPGVRNRLNADLRRRLWRLYDVAKIVSERGDQLTPDEWAAFHVAVSDVPECEYGQ